MDQTLKFKLQEYKQALDSLQIIIAHKDNDTVLVRDACIKRFEYCFDASHKLVKTFLLEHFGVDEKFPKSCFRNLRITKEFTEEEVEQLLKMTNDRNYSVHSYSESFAIELYVKIRIHYLLLKKIYDVVAKYGY